MAVMTDASSNSTVRSESQLLKQYSPSDVMPAGRLTVRSESTLEKAYCPISKSLTSASMLSVFTR